MATTYIALNKNTIHLLGMQIIPLLSQGVYLKVKVSSTGKIFFLKLCIFIYIPSQPQKTFLIIMTQYTYKDRK